MDKNNITTAPLCRIGTLMQNSHFKIVFHRFLKYILFYKSHVVVGMLISLLAIIVAAVVEHFRLEDWNQG